jgi:CYTH domain-containing protein
MSLTITKKYLVKEFPDLTGIVKENQQRYYLYNTNGIIIRIQETNGTYKIQRKVNYSDLVREESTIKITKEEFGQLKKLSNQYILRDSYKISQNINLRIYHGQFEGLNRFEVSFGLESEAKEFVPSGWFGKEITGTPLAQDGYLLKLTTEEFKELLFKQF